MNPSARVATALTISVVLAAALPGPAAGDGLPAGGDVYVAPLFAPDGSLEYTTVSVGRDTVVRAGKRGARTLVGSTCLRGDSVVPVVAYDGSPEASPPVAPRWS